jgi:hypothetical protein
MTVAFQPNAFQNPQNYDHFGFQVDFVDSEQMVDRISTDGSIQLLCDQWELGITSSDVWRARARANGVNIRVGLLDDLGDRQLVDHISAGKIDEWDLDVTPFGIRGQIRGRDAAAFLLDTTLYITYLAGGLPPDLPAPEALPPGLQPIPGVTQRLYLPGTWRASTIITDLARRCGLTCSYQAPDYIVRDDLEVNGPVLQVIQTLIQPFSFFEPYKIDVWVTGSTLNVRQRQGLVESPGPLGPTPGDLNTITAHDARIQSLTIRARYLDFIRLFRATGGPTGPCASGADLLEAFSEQYDTFEGGTSSRVTISGRKIKVLSAIFDQTKEVYNLDTFRLESRETTTNTWQPIVFDANCRMVNSPKRTSSQIYVESADPDTHLLAASKLITISYSYDTENFLTLQVSATQEVIDGEFQTTAKEVTRIVDNGIKEFNSETSTYERDSDGNLSHVSTRSGQGGGHRPGGPGRAPKSNIMLSAGGIIPYVAKVIDDVPGAKDFSLNNTNLSQAQLNTIYDQAVASSGCFEYEVMFTAANIPWIKKGQMLHLTDLHDEGGVREIVIRTFLVVEAKVEYDNSDVNNPRSLSQVRGVFWSKEVF